MKDILLPYSKTFQEYTAKKIVTLYPFSSDAVANNIDLFREKYGDLIYCNEYLHFSDELIAKLIANNEQSVGALSLNKKAPWDEELIQKYSKFNQFNWDAISSSETVKWDLRILESYKEKFIWNKLSRNKALPWSIDLIEKYSQRLDWSDMSTNTAIPWTKDLIDLYIYKFGQNISLNCMVPTSREIIEKYIDFWDWRMLSLNKGVPWTREFLTMYSHAIHWNLLSTNTGFPWNSLLFEEHCDEWDWNALSRNPSLPWSARLISGYLYKFHFGGDRDPGLCQNTGIKWDTSLIEEFINHFNIYSWQQLSSNTSVDWNFDLYDKFIDYLDPETLLNNKSFIKNIFDKHDEYEIFNYLFPNDYVLLYTSWTKKKSSIDNLGTYDEDDDVRTFAEINLQSTLFYNHNNPNIDNKHLKRINDASSSFTFLDGAWHLAYYIPTNRPIGSLSNHILKFKDCDSDALRIWSNWAADELVKLPYDFDYIVRALSSSELEMTKANGLDYLGNYLAKKLNAIYKPKVLIKNHTVPPMHNFNTKAEQYSALNALYSIRKNTSENFNSCNVLIIDDVSTTSTTIAEIVRALKKEWPYGNYFFFFLGKTSREQNANDDIYPDYFEDKV